MTYMLCSARQHFEFKTADAINDMGARATVPRRIEITKRPDGTFARDYRPFLPNFIFVAMSEEMWFSITRKRLFLDGVILPPIRRELDILPRSWADFQGFAQRAEVACDQRLEQHEAGLEQGDALTEQKIAAADKLAKAAAAEESQADTHMGKTGVK